MYKCMIFRRQSNSFAVCYELFILIIKNKWILNCLSIPFFGFQIQVCFIIITYISLASITHIRHIGSAIKCFECNSHYNQGCELDEVPSNFSVDCSVKQDRDDRNKPIQYTLCRKVLQVIEFSVNQCK